MRLFARSAIAVCLASCAQAPDDIHPVALGVVSEPAPPGELPRGSYVITPRDPSLGDDDEPVAVAMHRIIYLNYDGGTFTPGWNNSSTNVSSIPSTTSTIAPWGSPSQRAAVTACVQDMFAQFDVEVTDVDPGAVQHIESVIAGRPQDVGMQSGVGGVSPFNCDVIERSIVFTFAEVYGGSTTAICATAAQEVAHSFGLDHEYLCKDPMTYLSGCGAKSFQDVDAQCGEFSPRSCQCGGSTQNSVQMLLAALGPADGIPPTVSIGSPANGAVVEPGFAVTVNAADNVAVTKVELLVNGALAGTDMAAPWEFTTDPMLGDGTHTVQAIAYDSKLTSTAQITVTIDGLPTPGEDCTGAGECAAGAHCEDGVCVMDDPPPFPEGETGSPCEDADDCESGLCLSSGDDSRCTDVCDPEDPTSCPDGFDCVPTDGAESVCWPNGGGGGGAADGEVTGGCRASGGDGDGTALTALLLLTVVSITRRRRSQRAG